MKTEIQHLFNELKKIQKYPKSMVRINDEIKDIAFFPGGKGIYHSKTISNMNIMVLGHDYGNEKRFMKIAKLGRRDINRRRTWKPLLDFLKTCNIELGDCFLIMPSLV